MSQTSPEYFGVQGARFCVEIHTQSRKVAKLLHWKNIQKTEESKYKIPILCLKKKIKECKAVVDSKQFQGLPLAKPLSY